MAKIKPKKTAKISSRKNTKSKKFKNPLFVRNMLIFIIILLVTAIISFVSYIYLSTQETKKEVTVVQKVEKKPEIKQVEEFRDLDKEYEILDKQIEEIKQKLDNEEKKPEIKQELKPEKKEVEEKHLAIPEEYPDVKQVVQESIVKKQVLKKGEKPKLAIVIDDVVYASQVKALKSVGYPINMSFLPPTADHPHSAQIAQNLTNYMIHLPLQAMNFAKEEENTLHVGDSISKIEQRIIELKKLYPKAKYINNHTGSKFTSDDESMDKLMFVLKKHNLIFLDSKTTANTKAPKYARIHKVPFLSRDIFLDNVQEFSYIQSQLRQAIAVAKQRGYAVAIGHPYSSTIDVLRSSIELLRDIDVVYIDAIPLQ
ncbi:divergent polysaccharide deacetylase family protein [Arcobacter sp. FWKO B]|uniref:divergent polysaccharide deacetylase family protein n=1 Tax=Arcobacter sp. FWKO B TaxID=2593672 RepID=UPI0018A47108|nr:divergent polysaccharide deacetylase family protein [Arcobacter sp. FWKO B]QOG13084.1 divergent polysaccharide deacetylase family protein [Arcobacter sp. FWKO B]